MGGVASRPRTHSDRVYTRAPRKARHHRRQLHLLPPAISEKNVQYAIEVNAAMSLLKKKRAHLELDEEQEVIAAFIIYAEHVKRVKALCALNQTVVEKVISSYVKHRGGIQEVRVYEIPNLKFNPQLLDEKYFIQHFRFSQCVYCACLNGGIIP